MSSNRLLKPTILLIALVSSLCWAQTSTDPNDAALDPNDIQLELNFQDVPMQTILEYLSEKAGVIIISDNGLDRRLTVISRKSLGLDEAIALINAVLKDGGYAAVRTGRTLRIVTLDLAKTMNIPVTSGNDPTKIEAGDNVVTHIIPIKYAQAVKLSENLESLLPEYATIEANEETNTLIITDTTANIKRILEIIQAMDTHMSAVSEIKVFPLNKADATSTAELINKIFQEQAQNSSRGSGDNRPRGPMEMMMSMRGGRGGPGGGDRGSSSSRSGGDRGGGPSGASAAVGEVTAAADERTNSVVVSAPAEKLTLIEEVIRTLDTRSPAVADVKVFHLSYADAENTAELINEVFGMESRSQSSSQNQRGGFMSFMGRGGASPQTTSDSSSSVDVVAAADQRTNSLVVTGPPDTIVVIAEIVTELDANPEQERNLFVYRLKNATATNLMEILNNLFEEIQALNQQGTGSSTQRFQGQPTRGAPSSGGTTSSASTGNSSDLDEETYFEADEATNSLLIMTSTKNYEKIKPIIEDLDKPVGQVLIKVLFAEVTHSNSIDLGTEFSMVNLNSSTTTGLKQSITDPTSPVNLHSNGSTTSASSWLNPPLQGLGVTTVAGDITATIRALQESGRLNVLSRPYILTRNNQTAKITVGQQIPVATGESVTTGVSQTVTDYNDVGIILEVTPSINPDGLVNLDVRPEISNLTGEMIAISQNLSLPVFSTRMAETKVAVEDGHTIVIGGLIEDKITDNVSKIPLLGSIPLIGALFRHTAQEKSKTELLIFLTPHVAPEPKDLISISNTLQDQTKISHDKSAAEIYKEHMDAMKNE
jgi:general secretion pathway protein D